MFDVRLLMYEESLLQQSNINNQTSTIKHQQSNISNQTSAIKHQTSP